MKLLEFAKRERALFWALPAAAACMALGWFAARASAESRLRAVAACLVALALLTAWRLVLRSMRGEVLRLQRETNSGPTVPNRNWPEFLLPRNLRDELVLMRMHNAWKREDAAAILAEAELHPRDERAEIHAFVALAHALGDAKKDAKEAAASVKNNPLASPQALGRALFAEWLTGVRPGDDQVSRVLSWLLPFERDRIRANLRARRAEAGLDSSASRVLDERLDRSGARTIKRVDMRTPLATLVESEKWVAEMRTAEHRSLGSLARRSTWFRLANRGPDIIRAQALIGAGRDHRDLGELHRAKRAFQKASAIVGIAIREEEQVVKVEALAERAVTLAMLGEHLKAEEKIVSAEKAFPSRDSLLLARDRIALLRALHEGHPDKVQKLAEHRNKWMPWPYYEDLLCEFLVHLDNPSQLSALFDEVSELPFFERWAKRVAPYVWRQVEGRWHVSQTQRATANLDHDVH